MCQKFDAAAIETTHYKYPEAYVLNYMDYVLIRHPIESMLSSILADLTEDLEA
jgi:hypothetical protein